MVCPRIAFQRRQLSFPSSQLHTPSLANAIQFFTTSDFDIPQRSKQDQRTFSIVSASCPQSSTKSKNAIIGTLASTYDEIYVITMHLKLSVVDSPTIKVNLKPNCTMREIRRLADLVCYDINHSRRPYAAI